MYWACGTAEHSPDQAQESPPDQPLLLGRIHFPTSGAPAAQEEFELGVLALHSFWYEEARDHFRKARELDPGFAMAYWGEAMTHDAPLQGSRGVQDSKVGQAILDQLDELQAQGKLQLDSARAGIRRCAAAALSRAGQSKRSPGFCRGYGTTCRALPR